MTDLMLQRIPPNDTDIESSVLATMLSGTEHIDDIITLLSHDDFYKQAHKNIFRAIQYAYRKTGGVDIGYIVSTLKDKGLFESSGGSAYLSQIMDEQPIVSSVDLAAKKIRDKRALRELIASSQKAISAAYSANGNTADVINEAQKAIVDIDPDIKSDRDISIGALIRDEVIPEHDNIISGAEQSYTTTGFLTMDNKVKGFKNKKLIIVAARPGMGKSAFMSCSALNMAKKGIPVLVFSIEMPHIEVINRILSYEAKIDSQILDCAINSSHTGRLHEAYESISELPIFIDDSPVINADEIVRRSRRFIKKHGVRCVFIDYFGYISPSIKDKKNVQAEDVSRRMAAAKKELGVPIVMLAQLNRNIDGRNVKMPVLSDLRWTGAIEQDADVVVFIHRPSDYKQNDPEYDPACDPDFGTTHFMVAKNRGGQKGMVKMGWQPEYTRFYDIESRYDDYEGGSF